VLLYLYIYILLTYKEKVENTANIALKCTKNPLLAEKPKRRRCYGTGKT